MRRSPSNSLLAGRDGELSVLRAYLQEARLGQVRIVFIDGPAGIGKSTLLTEFVENFAANAEVIWLRCDQFERDISFSAAELLLAEPIAAGCSELEVGRRLLARLGEGRRAREVTVLAVDDAHLMDGPSARALRFALRRLRVEPFLAVVARRPGSPDDIFAIEDPNAATVVRPEPLGRSDARDLARGIRGWTLSSTTAERLVAETGGSPLLISSVLQNVAERAELETWTNVPASAAEAAARMLRSLDDEARRVVEAAAVLAQPADLITIGGVAEVTEVATGVGAATAAGLLTMDTRGAVLCAHTLLREAVYDSLPLDRRQDLHACAARWTSGDRSLGHRAAAVKRSDPALVAELVAAADLARSARRYDLAATQRMRARSISADPVERDSLLFEALIDRVWAQDLDGADQLSSLAESLTAGPLRSFALGLLARESGHTDRARTYLHEAVNWPADDSNRPVRQQAAVAAAWLYVRLGDGTSAIAALDAVDHIDDPELAGDARTTRGIALWQTGRDREALTLLQAVSLSSQGMAWEAELLSTRGSIHLYAGELAEAGADLDRTIAMSHLWRPSANQSVTYAMRCLTRQYRGDWDAALSDAAASRALATQAEAWSVVWARAASIYVPANRGQWDIAADHLAQARIALNTLPYAQVVDLVARGESALHTARGDHTAVLKVLQPLLADSHLEQLAAFRAYRWILPAWISSCILVGRLTDAERELDRYIALLRRWPGGPDLDRVGWLRGLLALARGDIHRARDHFAADQADPKTATDPFVHGQLRQAMGRLEQAAGRRREAVRHLTVAYDLFAQLRATPFFERCRDDLAASGLHSPSTDPRVLTERQEDVAALVSRGYTNKEVARELFVSAKAVEYHLRGVYSKLGITSRRELRRLRTPSAPRSQDPAVTSDPGILR